MNILKNSLVSLCIILLSFSSSHVYSTTITDLEKTQQSLVSEAQALSHIKNGEKYKKTIDALFVKHGENQNIVEKLAARVTKIQTRVTVTTHSDLVVLLNYLALQCNYYILKNNFDTQYVVEILETTSFDVMEVYGDSEPLALNSEEKKEVNEKILAIQANIFESSTEFLEKISDEFEKYTNYQETGDISIKAKIDLGDTAQVQSDFSLSDYEYRVATFDSQFKGAIDGFLQANFGDEDIDFKVATLIDLISKDGNMYLLLENLQLEGMEDSLLYKNVEDAIKKIAEEKNYIKFEDKETQAILEIFQSLTPEKLLNKGDEMFRSPLFVPYAKQGEKYLLIPSKHACDTLKELTNRFDPFNGKECSNAQYKKMIQDLKDENIQLSLKIGKDSDTFEMNMAIADAGIIKMALGFDQDTIHMMKLIILEDKKDTHAGTISMDYIKNKYLNFDIDVDNKKHLYSFNSTLNSNNNFETIDFNGKSKNDYGSSSCQLQLSNNTIKGGFVSKSKEYNYSNNSYQDAKKLKGTIIGKTNSIGEIKKINIGLSGDDLIKNTSPLDATMSYENGYIDVDLSYIAEGTTTDLTAGGHWDSSEKFLDEFHYTIDVKNKEWSYDPLSYETIYTGELKDVFQSNITLKNKKINGKTLISNEGEEIILIEHTGNISKNYIDLQNSFELSDYAMSTLPLSVSNLGIEDTINGNIDFSYDTRSNKNNFLYFIKVLSGEKILIELELDASGNRIYKTVEIEAPESYIDSEEILPELSNDVYLY